MAEKKNKKTTTAEKQLAKAMANTMPKNIGEMGSLIKTGSTDKNIVSKVTGPRKQQTLTAVRTDDGDVKIDASQKDIDEVVRNNHNWDGYKKHKTQEIENEIENNLAREKYGEKNSTPKNEDAKSPYANMSYGELSEKIKEVDSDLSRGIITADEAHSRQYEIDLWRIKKASTDELKKLREYWNEASEDMAAEGRAVSFNSGLSMIPSDEEVTKTDHADKYKDLVAAADAMLSTHKMMKEYDNELVKWGKKAIESGASDKYVPTEYAEKKQRCAC